MELSALPQDKKIILFDGVCNLCNTSVQFIIKHDKKDLFRFIPLQSDLGQKIIHHIGISNKNTDSIVLYEPNKAYYYKAAAALRIVEEIGGIFSLAKLFLIVPLAISNKVYDFVARNRYKWYGKKEKCMIPSPEIKAKFLA